MTPKERLLEDLTAEQFNNGGWVTPEPEQDDDLAPARRLRALAAEFDLHADEHTRGLA